MQKVVIAKSLSNMTLAFERDINSNFDFKS